MVDRLVRYEAEQHHRRQEQEREISIVALQDARHLRIEQGDHEPSNDHEKDHARNVRVSC